MMTLPNLFILGAPKCGTTSLYRWLADHPQIAGSPMKETAYFADPGSHIYRPDRNVRNGLAPLAALYAKANTAKLVRLEGTPSHIYSQTALAHIPDLPGAPKCLFVLREPAAQIRSLFIYFQNSWSFLPDDLSFDTYVDRLTNGDQDWTAGGNELLVNALENGRYVHWLRRWQARLGPDRMRVISFESLMGCPTDTLHAIADWIGATPEFYHAYTFPEENRSYHIRNARVKRLAVRLRAHLPHGPLYTFARATYRRLNTFAPAGSDDAAAVHRLRARFVAANQALSSEFGICFSQGDPA